MTSEVSICNQALSAMGTRSTIASLTEASNEARQCNLFYADVRDQVAGMAFWNFNRKTATASLLKAAPGTPEYTGTSTSQVWIPAWPAPPWLYEYAYPSDCLQVRYVMPQINNTVAPVPIFSGPTQGMFPWAADPQLAMTFIVAGDTDDQDADITVVLTNASQAIFVYTKRITDPNVFPAQFVSAFAYALAGKLAISLTGDKVLAKGMFEQADKLIVQARETDGNEGLTVIDTPADWIVARDSIAVPGYLPFRAPYPPLFAMGF